jgi:hypothetical protein
MLFWALSALCLYVAAKLLWPEAGWLGVFSAGEDKGAEAALPLLHELQETLEAGVVPGAAKWERLQEIPEPWGALAHDVLLELRKSGGSILPTLRRLRALAAEQIADQKNARARTSQAIAQAAVCGLSVPAFSVVLYFLLPGVSQHSLAWCFASGVGMLACAFAARWVMAMAGEARWGGLRGDRRRWLLGCFCAGERFLAMIRSGTTADEAWLRSVQAIEKHSPGLSAAWGFSIWEPGLANDCARSDASGLIGQAGVAIKKAIQASLMEGFPCTERAETILQALRSDLRAQVEKEVSLLSTRALKPLFLLVAPSMMGLLTFGLYLAWQEASL